MLKRVSSPYLRESFHPVIKLLLMLVVNPFKTSSLRGTECVVHREDAVEGWSATSNRQGGKWGKPQSLCVNRDQPNGSKVLPVCPLLPEMTTRTQHRTRSLYRISNSVLLNGVFLRDFSTSTTPIFQAKRKGGNVVFFKGGIMQGHLRWGVGF